MWAGIAKALVEKVEEEFGVLTTRLFRAIKLEKECEPENQCNQIRIHFNEKQIVEDDEFKDYLETNGNIVSCVPEKTENQEQEKCYLVQYKTVNDALSAKNKLQCFKNIREVSNVSSPPSTNTGQNVYGGFRIENILMTILFFIAIISSAVLFGISFTIEAFQVFYH